MLILGSIIALLGLAVVAYSLAFKATYHAEESTVIAKPAAEVFAVALDFERMAEWSPWLMHDPDCKIERGGPAALQAGGWHSWDSPKIGTGKLTNAELDAPRRAIQRLEFVKPFKSQAKVTWTFADDGSGGTKVTWRIDSGMPFVMRWMNRRMVRWLRSDFGCGLLRLRHLIDPSQPTMKFSFDGPCERPVLRCVGRAFKGSIEDMKKEMGEHFDALSKLRKEGGAVVTRTDSFDQGNETIAVTYGVEPAEGASPPAGAAPFEVAGGKYHKVTCTGSYDYMEYAWHQSFGSVQMNKHKFDKSRQGYELYVKGPAETDGPDGYVTEILLPIK